MAIAALDFSQPTKFTTEIRRRIAGALDPFCEELSDWMAGELGAEVQLSVADVAQRTWAEAKAQLPADSVAVAVEEAAIDRKMLLSVELSLVLQALECMLGGDAARAPSERHLSELDWKLAGSLLDAIVHELSTAWSELNGPALTRGERDVEGDAGVLVAPAEPTLAISLESSIAGQSSTLSLLIPWTAIEPIAESIRGAGGGHHLQLQAAAPGPEALARGVAGAQVLLRAEVASAQIGASRLLELLPGTLVELEARAEDGVRRTRNGEGYIDDPQLLRPVMASSIVTNNVQVTFAVFAGGVTAGLLSVLMLVLNGISLGSVVGLYASKGIARLLLAFVAPHGVLELFAICVAGGGGFLIAAGLLMPGPRTRGRALVENARRAIRLIAASTFLLVIAGALEGFVSPIEWWPIEGKLAVSGVTLVFLVAYLSGGRRRAGVTSPSDAGEPGALALAAIRARRAT